MLVFMNYSIVVISFFAYVIIFLPELSRRNINKLRRFLVGQGRPR